MVVHHIPPSKISGLSLHFMCHLHFFFVSKTPSFHFANKTFLETELGEVLNDKIYLKTDRRTQLVLCPETLRDATDTEPLSEK